MAHELSLTELLARVSITAPVSLAGVTVARLVLDSRDVKAGDVFVALSGTVTDGRQYLQNAFAQGAVAALVERAEPDDDARIVMVPGLRKKLSDLAGCFYNDPSYQQCVIGITGTNGKTTTSQLIAAAISELQGPCFVAGTLGYGLYGALTAGRHTTPDAIMMQALLADALTQGARHVSMEVSSHGLDQGRVEALQFRTAIFTNLTRDHLDYHGTMAAYGAAKKRLFTWPKLQHCVINADDAFGAELLADATITAHKWAFGLRHEAVVTGLSGSVYAERIHYSHDGIFAEIATPWGKRILQSPLLGEFNLSNLLAALTALCAMGYDVDKVASALGRIKPIAGRMERFGDRHAPMIVVDYAHTPDALEKAIHALRLHTAGKVAVIFGCGGDRDRGKRSQMGRIAEQLADIVVLANDNPRSEMPESIAAEIRAGMARGDAVRFIADRELATRTVLAELQAGDALLLAGKGHEAYTEINGVRWPYSEVDMVKRVLGVSP